MQLTTTKKSQGHRSKAQILQEAIEATGGLFSDALGSIKNYVDDKYPNFPWEASWSGQILAAKSNMRSGRTFRNDAPSSNEPPASASITGHDVRRAREFIERIGEGSVDKAKAALAFLEHFGSPGRVSRAVDAWSELVDAVGGDEQTADRTLEVIIERFLPPGFPRLADDTISTDAA